MLIGASAPRRGGWSGLLLSIDPVSLALEGIGGQGDLAARVVPVETPPVYLHTPDVQLPQAAQHLLPLPPPTPQAGKPHAAFPAPAPPSQPQQRGARPHLQEQLVA